MSLRSTTLGEAPTMYRQPTIRSKVWGFEPFWKFVNYDVEMSSNTSSASSNGKNNFEDDFFFGPTELKPDNNASHVSNKKFESLKNAERIIPIQRVKTTTMTIPPAKTPTFSKAMPALNVSNKPPDKNVDGVSNRMMPEEMKKVSREQKLLSDISNFNKTSTKTNGGAVVKVASVDVSNIYKKAPAKVDKIVAAEDFHKKAPTRDQ